MHLEVDLVMFWNDHNWMQKLLQPIIKRRKQLLWNNGNQILLQACNLMDCRLHLIAKKDFKDGCLLIARVVQGLNRVEFSHRVPWKDFDRAFSTFLQWMGLWKFLLIEKIYTKWWSGLTSLFLFIGKWWITFWGRKDLQFNCIWI